MFTRRQLLLGGVSTVALLPFVVPAPAVAAPHNAAFDIVLDRVQQSLLWFKSEEWFLPPPVSPPFANWRDKSDDEMRDAIASAIREVYETLPAASLLDEAGELSYVAQFAILDRIPVLPRLHDACFFQACQQAVPIERA